MALFWLAVFFALLGLPGFYGWTNLYYYYAVKIFIGVFNSCLFPCMISIIGNWFSKKNRGFIVGMWASCNNFGNIAGIQLAAWLLRVFDGKWQWTMIVASGSAAVMMVIVFFFLVPHPEEIGIFIEEMTEKEALIASATEKDVYANTIKNSGVAVPKEI